MSFIPSTDKLQTTTIGQVGEDGIPGTFIWDYLYIYHESPWGVNGRHGRNAAPPSHGYPGKQLDVHVSYDAERPAEVQVTSNVPADNGRKWHIDTSHDVLLDCHGGFGGPGGHGEPGGSGNMGYDGRDATQGHDAGNGGNGGHGGNGGYGTNGGDGGPGGHVSITVDESDLDILLAVQWNVLGGAGGMPGQHGQGGQAGQGGHGGAGYSWQESVRVDDQPNYWRDSDGRIIGQTGGGTYYRTENRHRSAGRAGRNGQHGATPMDQLYPGRNGPPGTAMIVVKHGDSLVTYPSRYWLQVIGFDLKDENDDGIFEPGEHVFISNIKVQNTGPMPTPLEGTIKVLVRATPRLQPVAEPVELPVNIQPGQVVTIPGTIKALITLPYTAPTGAAVRIEDTIELIAFSERLKRTVPEFKGGEKITYQYPVVLRTPGYLDAIAHGETVTFSWQVINISTKAYGKESPMRRPIGTTAEDSLCVLRLTGANADFPYILTTTIPVIEPGETVTTSIELKASGDAKVLSKGLLKVSLQLGDAGTGEVRDLMEYLLGVQVSPVYTHNPDAQFLLVINASAPESATKQLTKFFKESLRIPIDVFNLSLTGSFLTSTGENVCQRYKGKTIAILGNTFLYFQKGSREAWDLLDPAEVYSLLKSKTSLLIFGPENMESLKLFAKLAAAPLPPLFHSKQSTTSLSDVTSILQKGDSQGKLYTISVKKTLFSGLDSSMQSKSEDVQKQLGKKFPNRRFLVAQCESTSPPDAKKQTDGAIAIIEGLAQGAQMLGTSVLGGHTDEMTSYIVYMIVFSLPWAEQCTIYWNVITSNTFNNDRLKSTTVYKGLSYGSGQSYNVHHLVGLSIGFAIARQVEAELASFLADAPWPDTSISESAIMSHLPMFRQWVAAAPPASAFAGATKMRVDEISTLMGAILAAASPTGAMSSLRPGSRASRTHAAVQRALNPLVSAIGKATMAESPAPAGTPASRQGVSQLKDPRKTIESGEKSVKQHLAAIKTRHPELSRPDRLHQFTKQRLSQLAGRNEFTSLSQLAGPPGASVLTRKDVADRRAWEHSLRVKRDADIAWSRERIAGTRGAQQADTAVAIAQSALKNLTL